MRLLFDENLPKSLVKRLADDFPGSVSAEFLGLSNKPDDVLWAAARDQHLIVVSKDKGLVDRLLRYGPPPNSFPCM